MSWVTDEVAKGLRCPDCDIVLRWSAEKPDTLYCMEGHEFSVRNGVPVLIPEDLTDAQVETVDTFAYKWNYAAETMIEERTRIANEWFLRRFFDGHCQEVREQALDALLANAHTVLDAGCGLGNLTTMLARRAQHATVWGVDLSTAVHMVERAPNVRLVQGDITRVPISGQFDLIVSDGVLHHTPSTRTSMLALARRLADGGSFLFYVYRRKAPVREFADDHLRGIISAMEPDAAMVVCRQLADLGRQLRQLGATITVPEPIEALGVPAGSYDLHRFIYWHLLKCFWDDGAATAEKAMVTSTLENYDWYSPVLAHRHTRAEVESWLKEAMLEVVRLSEGDAGFAVHARRPA